MRENTQVKLLPGDTKEGRDTFLRTQDHTVLLLTAVLLCVCFILIFLFQGWEFKYFFQILVEIPADRVSTSARKHSSLVFFIQHSLHSSVRV